MANYAVGYAQRATAEADWQLHPFTDEATDDWINGLISRHRHPPRLPGELEGALRGLSVTLNEDESLLKRCFAKRELIHGYPRSGWGYSVLPETLTRAINPGGEFIRKPLRGTREPLGVLYVDNTFSGSGFREEYRTLHNFAAQDCPRCRGRAGAGLGTAASPPGTDGAGAN